ncbi:hypothetical protein EVAR_25381_1 [Eumeta japonica]|uniref:Uncharacterized protein n=1 Tax=Eumeta variegata TaxID=151549 RepID=A0A4C1V5J4_EUMVA|nr:hypothetical protein EVAR_25381_1 [Eumeta japonica]
MGRIDADAGQVIYRTFTEYGREATAFTVVFRLVNESSVHSSSTGYSITTQEAGNALVTPIELRPSLGYGDLPVFSGSHARLLFNIPTKK